MILTIMIYGYVLYRRKQRWYIFHVLGDYTNPHNPQYTRLLDEHFEKGVIVGRLYAHYWSFFPVYIINSIPDLQSYRYGMHLFAYRGVTGLAGDINFTFVMPPLISQPSAQKLVNQLSDDIADSINAKIKALTADQRKELESSPDKLEELVLKTVTPDWVQQKIGLVTVKKEDILLKEDRVVHAAINADSADFQKQHLDKWQKLLQIAAPLAVILILVGIGIASYILFQGFTNSQQVTYGYDRYLVTQLNQRINETNAYNAWLYADLKAIQVYGVQVPKNLTPIQQPAAPASTLPTLPSSLPSIPSTNGGS